MANDLQASLPLTAFSFRGYNVTNLGRTRELLQCSAYRETIERHLREAAVVCAETTGKRVDLVQRVLTGDEPDLIAYEESLALVMGTALAQIELLEEVHGVRICQGKLAFGYSLGELVAIAAAGVFSMSEVLRIPVAMAADSAALADGVKMGIVFSRGAAVNERDVHRLCRRITAEGRGTIGVSSVLSPNTLLILGQQETVARFKEIMSELLPREVHLRTNDNRWPPLHTPIMWQRNVVDRASVMMEPLQEHFQPPCLPVLSLVTGKRSYDEDQTLSVIRRWIDHPQRLWDAVCETLAAGVKTVVHVGPEPNVVPATFQRLADNIRQQAKGVSLGSLGRRAAAGLAERPWLSAVLPSRVALLRAPGVRQVILEEWLLENAPS